MKSCAGRLRTSVEQPFEVRPVELRRRIIHKQGRDAGAAFGIVLELPEQHRGGQQFLLSAGHPVARQLTCRPAPTGRPDGARRASGRARDPGAYECSKASARVRSTDQPWCRPMSTSAPSRRWPALRTAGLQAASTYRWRWLATSSPASTSSGSQARTCAAGLVGPQRGVALPERPLVSAPVLHEVWFHVEHTPVQVPAPLLRATVHEAVDLGIDGLDRQTRRQLRKPADRAAGKPGLEAVGARHACRAAGTRRASPCARPG